ncbi:MAG: ATP-binding protein [Pseudonocardiaceae bacterium]
MGVGHESFGSALRRLRERAGLTQEQLADRAGLSVKAVSALERGERRHPYPHTVRALGAALGLTAEQLAGLSAAVSRRGRRRELSQPDRPDETPRSVGVSVAQLPADVAIFTGRKQELAFLDRLLANVDNPRDAPGRRSTAVVISVISGTAGVGKTALALRWSHRVRDEFPGGQLYVDLRGYDPDQPLAPADALAGLLRSLGVPGQEIPLELDERAAVYRSLLNGRRMLVLLDNAATVEQVRPLLPGSPSCLVIVTSRDSLAGLVARHGARRLLLDLLPSDDAVALLRTMIGERVDAEPEAAAVLAGQCARLPLALGVAAELATARPATGLGELVGELAQQQRRLELMDAGGDPRTAVRAVFSWSYQYLPVEAARAFRLIGLHPGPNLDLYAAAALLQTSRDQAQHLLDLLARAHLVQSSSPGRFCMHDLLRAYAVHLAAVQDCEQDRRAALTHLFDYYLSTAAAAMDRLVPAEQHRRPRIPPASISPLMTDPPTARAWLDAERATLIDLCIYTAAHGWPQHTTRLAATLFRYLDVGGHYPEALVSQTHARHAAHHTGDRGAEACALTHLGIIYWEQSHYGPATDHLEHALTICREIDDHSGAARASTHLGIVCWQQGHYEQAADHLEHALTTYRDIGDREGEAVALSCRGLVYGRQGHYEQAADHLKESLTHTREIGDRESEATVLGFLGLLYVKQGHYSPAAQLLQQALVLSQSSGNPVGEARALDGLGHVYQYQGHYPQAAEHHQQALALFRELGDRSGVARALNGLGETLHATGQPHEARNQHTTALTLATKIGDRYEQGRAHNGIAHTYNTTSETTQARHHWYEALTLYTELGVPDAAEIHTNLSTLDQFVVREGY